MFEELGGDTELDTNFDQNTLKRAFNSSEQRNMKICYHIHNTEAGIFSFKLIHWKKILTFNHKNFNFDMTIHI